MKRSRGFGGMAAKKKDPKVPFTYAKMSREGAGKKKGPKKMYSDANVNPDGLPWTEEEKAEQKRRAERAREYQGGEAVKTGRKQVKREELRNKLSRLETRIKDAAELNVAREDFLLPEEAGFMEAEGEMEATNKVYTAHRSPETVARSCLGLCALPIRVGNIKRC